MGTLARCHAVERSARGVEGGGGDQIVFRKIGRYVLSLRQKLSRLLSKNKEMQWRARRWRLNADMTIPQEAVQFELVITHNVLTGTFEVAGHSKNRLVFGMLE